MRDERLRASCPGLWQAAAQVATPHLRNMATIGGNLCLDTRCTYYDQTEDWRRAIGYCMKKDGQTCWVATSSPRCLAVSSTDTAPALLSLDAEVRLVSASGERTIAVSDLYANDGMHYLTRRPDEILTEVRDPESPGVAQHLLEAAPPRLVRLSRRGRCRRRAVRAGRPGRGYPSGPRRRRPRGRSPRQRPRPSFVAAA